jgi:hypothetical protein
MGIQIRFIGHVILVIIALQNYFLQIVSTYMAITISMGLIL